MVFLYMAAKKHYGGATQKLTRAFLKKFCELLKECPSISNACARANIDRSTYYKWIRKARTPEATKIYKDFLIQTQAALAEFEAACLAKIEDHGNKSWQAMAWLLERRFREKYGINAEPEEEAATQEIDDEFK